MVQYGGGCSNSLCVCGKLGFILVVGIYIVSSRRAMRLFYILGYVFVSLQVSSMVIWCLLSAERFRTAAKKFFFEEK